MPVATGLSSIEGLPSFTLVINRGRFLHLSVGRTFFLNSFFNLHTYFFRAQRTVAPEIVAPNPVAANPPNQVVRAAIFTSRDVGMKIRVIFIFIWGIHFFESRFCSENSLKSKKYLEHSSFRYLASRSGYFKKMANWFLTPLAKNDSFYNLNYFLNLLVEDRASAPPYITIQPFLQHPVVVIPSADN